MNKELLKIEIDSFKLQSFYDNKITELEDELHSLKLEKNNFLHIYNTLFGMAKISMLKTSAVDTSKLVCFRPNYGVTEFENIPDEVKDLLPSLQFNKTNITIAVKKDKEGNIIPEDDNLFGNYSCPVNYITEVGEKSGHKYSVPVIEYRLTFK